MTFVRDVAVPNGSTLDPNAPFERIWRVRNDGTCTWSRYEVVFARGDQMSGPAAARIPEARPGQSIDISVPMIAPARPGDYRGFWVLRANNGATFGGLVAQVTVRALPTPTPPPESASLAGTSWAVTSLNGTQQPLAGTQLTLSFLNAEVLGTAGCNTFRGPYVASGTTVALGPLATTRAFCDDARAQQEAAYLEALKSAASWRRDGTTLVLFDAAGTEVVRFAAL
jgi:heat shock protein HslJ